MRHLQSPPLAISWQNHHSQASSQKQKNGWSTKFSILQLSPSLSLEHLQVISKLVENSNLHTINKKYTFQEQVCERCLNKRNCNCQRKKIQSINVIMQCNATPPKCINSQHGLLSHSQLLLNAMPKKKFSLSLTPPFCHEIGKGSLP